MPFRPEEIIDQDLFTTMTIGNLRCQMSESVSNLPQYLLVRIPLVLLPGEFSPRDKLS